MNSAHRASIAFDGETPKEFLASLSSAVVCRGRIVLADAGTFDLPMDAFPGAGAQSVFIYLEPLENAGDVEILFATAEPGEGVILSPGGFLHVAMPAPTAGPQSVSLVADGDIAVQYFVLG